MNTYSVTVYYSTPASRRSKRFDGIIASSKQFAETIAIETFRTTRKSSTKAKVISAQATAMSPAVRPIMDGDTITLPLTGTVEIESADTIVLRGKNGAKLRVRAEELRRHLGRPIGPKVTTEFWSVYPNGNVYQSDHVIRRSQYDLTQIVQIKVTKHNGKIVNKEFL